MALRHSKSQPSVCSQVDLFSLPPTETSVESSLYAEYSPVTNIQDGKSLIEFRLAGTNTYYYDLLDSFLTVTYKLKNADDTDLAGTEDLSVCNNFLHSLFKEVDLSLQNQSTSLSNSNGTYAYKAYFETLFKTYFKNKTDCENALFYLDTDKSQIADANTGYKSRKEAVKGKELKEISGRLYLDLADQDRFILNGMDMRLVLTRNSDAFCLCTPVGTLASPKVNAKIVITNAVFRVRRHLLYPAVTLSHQKLLEQNHVAQYPTINSQVNTYSIPKGNLFFSEDNIYFGTVPSRIILGLVSNDAFIGNDTTNPFLFSHNNVTCVNLMVNNVSVPSRPITVDFAENLYQDSFHLLNKCVSKMNDNKGLPFTKTMYANGYTLFGFDIFPLDLTDSTLHLERQGSCKLELTFSAGLKDAVTIILYSEKQRVLTIDKDRRLTSQ